jgi:hypothetical protein
VKRCRNRDEDSLEICPGWSVKHTLSAEKAEEPSSRLHEKRSIFILLLLDEMEQGKVMLPQFGGAQYRGLDPPFGTVHDLNDWFFGVSDQHMHLFLVKVIDGCPTTQNDDKHNDPFQGLGATIRLYFV